MLRVSWGTKILAPSRPNIGLGGCQYFCPPRAGQPGVPKSTIGGTRYVTITWPREVGAVVAAVDTGDHGDHGRPGDTGSELGIHKGWDFLDGSFSLYSAHMIERSS